MKQYILQTLLRSTILLLLALVCVNLSAQVEIMPPVRTTPHRTTPAKPRPPKPAPVKKCGVCGKPLTSCPYKGNHPRCADCGQLTTSCQYGGKHPRCADCGELLTKCRYNGKHPNGHEYVDLGLPSGTKWATCNVGASSPEDYGSYFAWGETTPKSTYTWGNYKYCKGSIRTMTKYCQYSDFGTVDNKTELDLADDAARVNWGGTWRMPSKAQQDELKNTDNCTWTWTTLNGKNGYRVTSKFNGNSIFLPAAGYRYDGTLCDDGSNGNYWSRSLYAGGSGDAHSLNFISSDVYWMYSDRYVGRSVRPVSE